MKLQVHDIDGQQVFDFTDCGYEDRFLPKGAGFRWDGDLKYFDSKRWYTTDAVRAALLHEYADDDDTKAAIAPYVESLDDSRSDATDFVFPTPDGLVPYAYQNAGVETMLKRDANLLGDEMGLGKTIQGIGLINADDGIKRVLVICPASLKINWRNEIKVWSTRDTAVGIAHGKSWPSLRADADVRIVIINYDILTKHDKYLKSGEWDLVLIDEGHYLKNKKAQRTKCVFGGTKTVKGEKVVIEQIRGRKKVIMTGTPILNRPIEIQPLLAYLDPDRWGNFMSFAKRYCGAYKGRFGWDFSGASNLGELQDILRSTVMVRRLKADVLTELPDKIRKVVEVEIDDAELVAEERALFQKFGDDPYAGALTTEDFAEMSKVRHRSALAKLPSVIKHVESVLESEDKVVIGAWHRDVMELLMESLAEFNPVGIWGGMSGEAKNASVEAFQGNKSVRVFVGQMQAAGVGLTLTAASRVVFAEMDWQPGNVAQFEDRCHRIGQKDTVWVDYVVAQETLDANLASKLASKKQVISKAMDVKRDHTRRENAPAKRQKRDHVDPSTLAPISFKQAQAILEALRGIAGEDGDRARDINGVGFSKFDGDFGHAMAGKDELTGRMAQPSRKLVKKYWRQVDRELFELIFPDPAEWPKVMLADIKREQKAAAKKVTA